QDKSRARPQRARPDRALRRFERLKGGRGTGEAQEDGGVQGEHRDAGLGERKQAEPVDVAVEEAEGDEALLSEFGGIVRGYGGRNPAQVLPASFLAAPGPASAGASS